MNKDEKFLGNELEKVLKEIGADQLAELYEETTGNDCGCEKRKEWLNAKHAQLKKWWNQVLNCCRAWWFDK